MSNNITEASLEEQLVLLKDWTRRMGVLHEAQILQLKTAPWGYFPTVKSFEVYPDLEKHDILFELKLDGKKPADFKNQCERVDNWIKWLLGDEWIVRVKVLKKQVFRSGPIVRTK